MRRAVQVAIACVAMTATAHAGVDDDPAAADAWCDGRRIIYDEVALVGADRVPVRHATAGCTLGFGWIILIGGGWGDTRVIIDGIPAATFAELWTQASAIIDKAACGAGTNPSDLAITTRTDGTPTTIHCAVGFAPEVGRFAEALRGAQYTRSRPDVEIDFDDDVIQSRDDVPTPEP